MTDEECPMEPIDIGDIELWGGDHFVTVTILTQEPVSRWTVAGAEAAVAYLQAWLREQEGVKHD
jgi:hypothetical protein